MFSSGQQNVETGNILAGPFFGRQELARALQCVIAACAKIVQELEGHAKREAGSDLQLWSSLRLFHCDFAGLWSQSVLSAEGKVDVAAQSDPSVDRDHGTCALQIYRLRRPIVIEAYKKYGLPARSLHVMLSLYPDSRYFRFRHAGQTVSAPEPFPVIVLPEDTIVAADGTAQLRAADLYEMVGELLDIAGDKASNQRVVQAAEELVLRCEAEAGQPSAQG